MTDQRPVASALAPLLALIMSSAPAAPADPGLPETPGTPGLPAHGHADAIFRDPVLSPLLDHHYRGADARPPVPEDPGAETFDQRFQIVYAAQPHPGMRVADIGIGSGTFTALFARAVGTEGAVYAVDTAPDVAARIEALAKEYRVANIVAVVDAPHGAGLPAEGVDLAFLCDSYRRLDRPGALLESIHKALVPFGSLIIIDDRRPPDPGSPWGEQHRRADRDRVVAQVEQAGFRLVEELRFLREHYFLRFEKLGEPPGIEVGPIESTTPVPAP